MAADRPPWPADAAVTPPSFRARIAVAVLLGTIIGLLTSVHLGNTPMPDFLPIHHGVRVWAHGINPYELGLPVWEEGEVRNHPFLYPFPAILLLRPLASLTMPLAGGVFMGISTALLSFGLSRGGWSILIVLLSAPFVLACSLGQWSPLLVAMALLTPFAAGFLIVKPTIGLPLFLARPSVSGAAVGVLIVGASLIIWPVWPGEWLANTREVVHHPAPVFMPGGFVLLLAWLRWRRPEARLLGTMALMPQVMLFADQLALILVARNSRERWLLITLGWAGMIGLFVTSGDVLPYKIGWPWVFITCYLPAMWLVLRRRVQAGRARPAMARWEKFGLFGRSASL